jgi:hypothetical protein
MDLTPYVEELRRQVAVAADAGGDEARAVAEQLIAPLESAIRLTLLDALSAAADEITRELAPGSVELRLRRGQADFVVATPPDDGQFEETAARNGGAETPVPPPVGEGDESTTMRINFRLPDHLKARIEAAADQEGQSVNSWLIRAASVALQGSGPEPGRRGGRRNPRGLQQQTGWVR